MFNSSPVFSSDNSHNLVHCLFHVWTLRNFILTAKTLFGRSVELTWVHMHFHQSAVCIHKCWLCVPIWLAATVVHRFCLQQLAWLSFPLCVHCTVSNSDIEIAISISIQKFVAVWKHPKTILNWSMGVHESPKSWKTGKIYRHLWN